MTDELQGDAEVEFLTFSDLLGQDTFWHSSAHVLGAAIEEVYPDAQLTIGPALHDGFYYDFFSPSGQVVKDHDSLNKTMKQIIKKNFPFERLILTKEQALEMFEGNPFKQDLISRKINDDELTSVFKLGEFVDLCTGPHVPSTRYIQSIKVTKNS